MAGWENKDSRGFKKILNTVTTGLQSGLQTVQSSVQRQGNSNFYTASIQQQTSLKSGWLKKQGGVVKNWHRRWFTIKGDHMYYFNSEDESSKPLGIIFLPGNKVVEVPFNSADPDKFLFEIQPGGEKPRMTSTHETYPLSALTDDERKAWVRVIRRVMYAEKGGAIFGQSLQDTMRYELQYNRKIPEIVVTCVEYLTHVGLETEGIFRLPGRTAVIRQLREMFDCGERPDLFSELVEADFNTIASLLKQYLRELPQPIIPPCYYESVMKAVIRDMPTDRARGLENLSAVLREIPAVNYNLLHYLCQFLYRVSQQSDKNKMTETNLATVFAQCIIKPEDEDPALLMGTAGNRSQVVLALIRYHAAIFNIEYTAEGSSVVVDNLLDIDTSGSYNQSGTMTHYNVPPSPSVGSDLLGVDLNSNSLDVGLPAPIFPSVSTECLAEAANGVEDEGSDEEWDEEEEEEEEQPVFGSSVRASRAQSDTAPEPQKPKSSPIPPPRPSKRPVLPSTESGSSSIVSLEVDTTEDLPPTDAAEDSHIQELLSTNSSDFSSESDLRSFVDTVLSALRSQSSKVKSLNQHILNLKETHKQQINKMAGKIHKEKEATGAAVEKIMSLQSQLQEYQLRHSRLE